jgi:hypothetical protein
MFQRILALAAWCCLAFIAFATLSPIGLRPRAASVGYEHVAAFAVAGLLFGLAYPLRKILVIAIVFGTAVLWKYFSWSLLIATPTGRSYWRVDRHRHRLHSADSQHCRLSRRPHYRVRQDQRHAAYPICERHTGLSECYGALVFKP